MDTVGDLQFSATCYCTRELGLASSRSLLAQNPGPPGTKALSLIRVFHDIIQHCKMDGDDGFLFWEYYR
jgi:hypothetical protein